MAGIHTYFRTALGGGLIYPIWPMPHFLAANYNGVTTQRLTIPVPTTTGGHTLTFALFLEQTLLGAPTRYVFDQRNAGSAFLISDQFNPNSTFWRVNGNSIPLATNPLALVPAQTWVYVSLVSTQNLTAGLFTFFARASTGLQSPSNLKLGQLRLYTRQLSDAELRDPQNPSSVGLYGAWLFDGNDTATVLHDSSGAGRHGTKYNF